MKSPDEVLQNERGGAADHRADHGAGEIEPTVFDLRGFRLQPVPFFLGLIFGTLVGVILLLLTQGG